MKNKHFAIGLCTILGVAFLCTGCWTKKETSQDLTEKVEQPVIKEPIKQQSVQAPKAKVVKHNLYSSTPYDLPLFSVVEISKLPLPVKETINNILEKSQGFYFLKKENDKVVILLQNPVDNLDTYSRHNLQFAEVDMNGKANYHTAGYNGITGETFNITEQKFDEWEFDESLETKRPIKHISFDENGHVKYVEKWNYDENEPIKYEMKDSKDKVISVLKESQDNDSNYRKEHVFYDNEGNTTMSLSVNYDGANISRMTFYNSKDSVESMSIMSEYQNGLKTKELIYNKDYKLVNTVTSDYIDGERKDIKIFDTEGNETDKISS